MYNSQHKFYSYPFSSELVNYDNFWKAFTEVETINVANLNSNTIINNTFCEANIYYKVGLFSKKWTNHKTFDFKPNNKKYIFQIGEHKNLFGHFTLCDITYFLNDIGISVPSNFKDEQKIYTGQIPRNDEDCFSVLWNMILGLRSFDGKNLDSMRMREFWDHKKMNWIGPWSIGHLKTLKHFENFHQVPFLKFIPDRTGYKGKNKILFSDGNYAASMGYPSLVGTHLGEYFKFPPSGKPVRPFVMDFWSCDGEKLVDNWVQIDMLDLFANINRDYSEYLKANFEKG